jgi:hypothetical protein
MIDRTQEDINQDVLIAELGRTVKELKEAMRTVRDQQSAHEVTLRGHQSRLETLEPVRGIIEHVAAIKAFCDNWKRGFAK